MIRNIAILLVFQLGGEMLARGAELSVPGPVIGLGALFVTLLVVPGLAERMRDTANGLLAHLSLLFVPAGVGVTAHLTTFAEAGLALAAALVGSTVLAILAGVGAFLLTARLTGADGDE
ncbi:MAG: CidA/LrgA family protein [Sediminimonas qiaohouensis]|uniref:CidA/LrgA family protein n=1 Tax=Sediminimonas qiaohouensis TaxID=552061 RepID=A0A7C9LLA2_9RHOB|nr:CidA/LrgA family protein [Sediminimonas qiaohouensis]MTJ03222.1 CidA/LrgA family protein [Sediminimonas qiaohouensis]